MRLGAVNLTITDIERAVDFYRQAVGLQVHHREVGVAELGVGGSEPLIVLTADADASRPGENYTGLYHVALLVPDEREFARGLQRLKAADVPIKDTADHYVSRSIYFDDPDGNELEITVDWPRSTWPAGRQTADRYDIGYEHADLDPLYEMVAGDPVQPLAPAEMVIGHLNLVVADLEASVEHYTDKLGLEVTCFRSEDATFVSWEGYHSHLALNTWWGKGLAPAPPHTVGMRYFTVIGSPDEVVVDPSGNVAHLVPE